MCARRFSSTRALRCHMTLFHRAVHSSITNTVRTLPFIPPVTHNHHNDTDEDISLPSYDSYMLCSPSVLRDTCADRICQEVFCFFDNFADSTSPLYSCQPEPVSLTNELCDSVKMCIADASAQNYSVHDCDRYYLHVTQKDSALKIPQAAQLRSAFPSPRSFRAYCENQKRLEVV